MSKRNTFLAAAATLFATLAFAAGARAAEDRQSAWEKICLDGTAAAACDKASSILSDKLIDSEDQPGESTLRERLLKVSKKGCDSGHLASCVELVGADDHAESLQLGLGVAKKTCTAHPDPKSQGCKYMSQWQSEQEDSSPKSGAPSSPPSSAR